MLKRLADRHPQSVAQLTLQYRMNEDICLLPNILVYRGALKCADDTVRKSKLSLPGYPLKLKTIIKPGSNGVGWLLPVLNPNKNVVFVNTDSMGQNLESSVRNRDRSNKGGGVVNEKEIELAKVIVHGLLICGMGAASIGIISPYRAQVRHFFLPKRWEQFFQECKLNCVSCLILLFMFAIFLLSFFR
jgi:Superfamily I DNA and RNA helicases and helicase subunits